MSASEQSEQPKNSEKIEFLSQLLSSVREAVVAVDESLNITYWNRMAESLTGWTAEEADKESVAAVVQKLGIAARFPEIVAELERCGYYTGEISVRRRDGTVLQADVRIKRLYEQTGGHRDTVALFRDISGQRKAEEAARERERNYAELAEFASAGIYEFDFQTRRFTYVNEIACRLSGYSREELLSLDPNELLEGQSKLRRIVRIDQWLNGTAPGKTVEYNVKTKDGDERIVQFSASVKTDSDGKPVSVTAIGQDVTEQRSAEAALRESERKYEELVKYAPAGIYELNFKTNRFTSVNDAMCQISGYSREEILALNPLDVLAGQSKSDYIARTGNWLGGKKPFTNAEYRVIAKDGREIDTLMNVSFTTDKNGEPLGATGIIYDITERKRMEKELRKSREHALCLAGELEKKNRLITDFFINTSHEFKTPLSILMLGIDLLEKKAGEYRDGGAELLKNIAVMRQNSYRLNRLVANLLDISKLDAGFMEPQWEIKNVVEWIGSLVRSTELYARQKGLELCFSPSISEKRMSTDGFMLDRIMLNLLSNAIKHTPAGGRIDVFCRASENGLTVSVKDSGEGIPEDKKPIIFDRFRQVNTSLVRASEGCGIGLALTKSLVDLLGGRIWFESELGRGSEFSFELPVLQVGASLKPVNQNGMQLDKRVQIELSGIDIS